MSSLTIHTTAPVGAIMEHAAEAIPPAVARATLKAANFAGGSIIEEIQATFQFSELARTFLPATFISTGGDTVSAGALSDHVAARILDQGGTIRPKTVSKLAIPLTDKAKNMWPREWAKEDLFVYKDKASNAAYLAEAKGGDRIQVHYKLVSSATIKPKYYLAKSVDRYRRDHGDIFDKEIAAAIEGGMSEGANG